MSYFGVISEGDTDYVVLENILIGYFEKDVTAYINQLQPPKGKSGGWSRVLKYCGSLDFKNDFIDNDFMVIQIDTDKSFETPFDVLHEEKKGDLLIEDLIERVKDRFSVLFKSSFGDTFYQEYAHRILFAITVHSTECWLLTLYFKDEKDKSEIKGCYEKLNKKVKNLQKTFVFYDKMSTDFSFPKKLNKAYNENLSFKIFMEHELKLKVPKLK
jgi:hypothetical protein